jgi:hypothetical protein
MNTPMQLFGSEAPPGWAKIITPLIERCQKEGASIFQIKEKFGMLRFYADGASEELEAAIADAERASARICQECGAEARTRSKGDWLRTLCDTHAKEQGYPCAGPTGDGPR